jgi:hypothetical protein
MMLPSHPSVRDGWGTELYLVPLIALRWMGHTACRARVRGEVDEFLKKNG